ncbi:MAG TPA: SDR family oxidoreductase [Magnetospirillaceae bacterium]|jgi:NAD(P)-dependent dehydrogenase (short-subunit alcohol dehydrogenase family)
MINKKDGAFANKIAVITGGTQGLGEATARLFAERGAAGIVICGRNATRGKAVATELTEGGTRTFFVQADLGKIKDVRKVVAEADKRFGKLDALVNVAAITDRGNILDTPPELFDEMFAVNVKAPFFLMQDALKIMRREKTRGTVVNILSMSGHGGQPFIAAYCASKGAMATLTRNTAFAMLPDRIRVNGLNIGWMDSPGETNIQAKYHGAPKDWIKKAERGVPFGRLLKPDEVAKAIAFLASDESGMMTGSIVDFDQTIVGVSESGAQPKHRLPDPQVA